MSCRCGHRTRISYAEIGPLPPRDRSKPVPRSVEFRLEIGPVLCRDCGVSGHLRQGAYSTSGGGSRWGAPRGTRRRGRGSRCPRVPGAIVTAFAQHEEPCPDARACRGRRVLHTRVRSASVGTAESCGTALSVAIMVLLPCAQTPSPHMGTRPPHTLITRKAHNSNKNQLPPRKDPTLPCATPTTTTPTRHTTPHTTNPPQTPTGTGPISTRNSTDLGTEYDRSRCGTRPISMRSATDFGAEPDRSRCGIRPISRNRMRYSQAPHQTDRPH